MLKKLAVIISLSLIIALSVGCTHDVDVDTTGAFTKEDFEPYINLLEQPETTAIQYLGDQYAETVEEYDPSLKELLYSEGSTIDPSGEIVVLLAEENGEFKVTSMGFTVGTTSVSAMETHLTNLFGEPTDVERDTDGTLLEGYWKDDDISYHLIGDFRFENRALSLYIAPEMGQYVHWLE